LKKAAVSRDISVDPLEIIPPPTSPDAGACFRELFHGVEYLLVG
jgi:hypothetical protein